MRYLFFSSSSFSVEEFNLVKDDSSKIGYLFIPDLHQRSLLKNLFCGRLLSPKRNTCFFLSTETTEYAMFNLDTNSSKCTVHVHNSTNLVIDSLRAKRCGWRGGQVSCFRTFLSIQEDVACQKLESIEQWPGSGSGSGLGRVCQRWKGKSQCRGAVYRIDFEHATNLFTRASNSQDSVNHKGN